MWKANLYEVTEKGLYSVRLTNTSDGTEREYWMDVLIKDGDVEADWNQYIFSVFEEDDMVRKAVQEDPANYEEASSEAVHYLEENNIIRQEADGSWTAIAED